MPGGIYLSKYNGRPSCLSQDGRVIIVWNWRNKPIHFG